MNKRQRKVLQMLKPKVKALGFNEKELKSVAAKIADNLTSEEDASDEDVNAEIETSIEAVLPFLVLGQSYANRVINDSKKNVNEEDDDDDEEDDEEEVIVKSKSKSKKSKAKDSKFDELTELIKTLTESNKALASDIASIKGEKVTNTRREKLETLLKGTGSFGKGILRSFDKLSFKDEDEFNDFLTEAEEDLKTFNQERANAGLELLGAPGTGGSTKGKKDEPKVLSEDEIKAIAAM